MKLSLSCVLLLLSFSSRAQNYTSYFTGNPVDVVTQPAGGVCLMGGATEDDNAMTWFLEQADGGDILVIRASGSDGYNDYFYTDLGVTVNSVETIVWNDATASDEAYIHTKIEQAEAIWIAGGDQWNYVSYWRDTPIDSLINEAIAERKIVIGGTSAGMAILGAIYFTAENGTVTSATALNDPYASAVTVDDAPFLDVPYMDHIVTDTHYDNPDRRGRHVVFMARAWQDLGHDGGIYSARGIACEEYVAVCVDTFGIARVYGGYPAYDEQAYFIRATCDHETDVITGPDQCIAGSPLEWGADGHYAFTVYKINGTASGANYFNLNNWEDASGGEWQNWGVDDGVLATELTSAVDCVSGIEEQESTVSVYPNPAQSSIHLFTGKNAKIDRLVICDLAGRIVAESAHVFPGHPFSIEALAPGTYVLTCYFEGYSASSKLVVK